MRVLATVIGAALLLGCGVPVKDGKDECARDGGTFIEHSDGSWDCEYPPRGVDDG